MHVLYSMKVEYTQLNLKHLSKITVTLYHILNGEIKSFKEQTYKYICCYAQQMALVNPVALPRDYLTSFWNFRFSVFSSSSDFSRLSAAVLNLFTWFSSRTICTQVSCIIRVSNNPGNPGNLLELLSYWNS